MFSSLPSNSNNHDLLTGRNSTAPSPPPASPTRPGRLRGLSYLRNYTHNHLLSRESHTGSNNQRPSITRATSYPSTATSPPASPTVVSPNTQPTIPDSPSARVSNPDNINSTSGWLPTVGGRSGVSRITTEARSTATASPTAVLSNGRSASEITTSMTRTRSATVGSATSMAQVDGGGDARTRNEAPATSNGGPHGMAHQLPSIRFTAHQDPRVQRPSLVFSPMARILPTGKEVIKVGRYSERDAQPVQAPNVPSAAPVGFKSKVVSRRHCEFWCAGGRWYIKDVKSSSGTFLNHIRLSSPGTESRPFPINDGDIVQLGIDFKGGEEMIFRCVKIRVELNKGWQNGPSSFNVQSHKRLRELNNSGKPAASGTSQDCSICLGAIAPCQSLFVAPCSHTWHYKCIRVIINGPHWPHFICPNCRSVADLEAELDEPFPEEEWEEIENMETDPPVEAPAGTEESRDTRQPRPIDNSDETYVPHQEPRLDESDQDHSSPDGDAADTSEDSDQVVNNTSEAMVYLQLEDEPPSPLSSASSHPPELSNATVPPVDIVSRKPASGLSASARDGGSTSHLGHDTARTPSPNGLPSSLNDPMGGVEGPMTPRNDAGPFVFDGSAGRFIDLPLDTMADIVLNPDISASQPQETTPETPQQTPQHPL